MANDKLFLKIFRCIHELSLVNDDDLRKECSMRFLMLSEKEIER